MRSRLCLSYVFVFPALIVLRYKYPNVLRPCQIPGGMAGAWIVGGITWLYAMAATVFSLWPGLFTSGVLDKTSNVTRSTFEISVLVTMAIILGIGVVFYFLGKGHAVHDVLPGEAAPVESPEMAGVTRT